MDTVLSFICSQIVLKFEKIENKGKEAGDHCD